MPFIWYFGKNILGVGYALFPATTLGDQERTMKPDMRGESGQGGWPRSFGSFLCLKSDAFFSNAGCQ